MTTDLAPAPAPRRRGSRRIVTWFGVTVVLAGLGVLAWFSWQYFGTNVVAKHEQAEVKKAITIDWGRGIDGDAIGLLRVKRFGDDYEMPIVKGVDAEALARGVGWDPGTDEVGKIGNFVVAGHRVTHGEPFAKFPSLRKGDRVVVETRTAIRTYRLRNSGTSITVDFTQAWPLWPVPDPKASAVEPTKEVITLVTCSELFHTRNRSVVIGDLVKTVRKTAANTKATAPATATESSD